MDKDWALKERERKRDESVRESVRFVRQEIFETQ